MHNNGHKWRYFQSPAHKNEGIGVAARLAPVDEYRFLVVPYIMGRRYGSTFALIYQPGFAQVER
jgi:hypothetical protein